MRHTLTSDLLHPRATQLKHKIVHLNEKLSHKDLPIIVADTISSRVRSKRKRRATIADGELARKEALAAVSTDDEVAPSELFSGSTVAIASSSATPTHDTNARPRRRQRLSSRYRVPVPVPVVVPFATADILARPTHYPPQHRLHCWQ